MMTDYILFLFTEQPNQDEFVKEVAEDIAIISDSEDIKFYYGSTSAIFTFKSDDTIDDINDFLNMILERDKSIFVLLPYNHDKMSVGMSDEYFKHLFGNKKTDKTSGFETTAQNMSEEDTKDMVNKLKYLYLNDEDDDDDELKRLVNKPKQIEIDDVLDKISRTGMSSLTEQEKKFLETYSKSC